MKSKYRKADSSRGPSIRRRATRSAAGTRDPDETTDTHRKNSRARRWRYSLVVAGIAWWKTAPPALQARKPNAAITSTDLVDQSTYTTAQRLAQLAVAPEELSFSQSAVRIADHELDLAFTEALRDVEAHPPALSADAAAIQARIAKSQTLFSADQQRVNDLTAALAQAKADQKDKIQDQLDLAQSKLELDKDELDEANQNLLEAGGNPRQQIESMVQEHDAQTKAHPNPPAAKAAVGWSAGLDRKISRLVADQTERTGTGSGGIRRCAKGSSAQRQTHGAGERTRCHQGKHSRTRPAHQGCERWVLAPPPTPQVQHSHEDAASLVGRTKAIAADQAILTLVNRRIADQNQLARVYSQWASVVALQSRKLAHGMLLDALIVIGVLILLLLLDGWLQHLLDRPKLDRRQVETLRSITRMSLRVVAVLIILLVVIGIPSQFATTIGIVGAGLTVALKDFIVAFFGWLVLMGRNGIRLGDWVEINGVSGEVTELGMFHTVLLETGNWSDSGHPTGRRVTFTNSFAIEGHYFNFSTSGQWLWDELQVVVPIGRDPYPIVEAITKQVVQATADSSQQAEQEWQRAVPAQRGKSFSGTPGVNVKPVVGGVEISVRYITRANERYLVRAKLYQQAVDLLGAKPASPT